MNKLLISLLISLISLTAQAQIQVDIDPSQITLGERFRLTITQDEPASGGGIPNLTPLRKDFTILGTERHVSFSIINGQSQSLTQWVISLKARKAGVLTLPAIQIGLEKSTPMTVNVIDNANYSGKQTSSPEQNGISLITEVSKKNPYVNQQIIYTVKLYISQRLLDADYQAPQADNALLIPLGDAKHYQQIQNNKNYIVKELTYAIFPQKSGTLKIKSPTFTALIYDLNPLPIKLQDKAIELNVQPIPSSYKGKTWLPAKQIKLTQDYEHSNETLEQGSTLIRTITLEGIAIPAQLLPKLDFGINSDFSVYPEYTNENTVMKQGELVGSVQVKVTYLFKNTGEITIPELKLPWFNTETGKSETALLPPKTIKVTPAVTQSPVQTSESTPAITPNDSSSAQPMAPTTNPFSDSKGWLLALAFALAWIATLGLWYWQRHTKHSNKGAYKKALAELQKACTDCDPLKARDALLKWASLHWPDAPILNLSDLTQLTRDAQLKKQVHLLSQSLYKREERMLWRGDELLKSVLAEKHTSHAKSNKSPPLPPINPM